METAVLPHKCLTDMDTMYLHLKDKIHTAKTIGDLIPFLKSLSKLNDLKTQLIGLLDKQYNVEKQKEIKHDTQKKSSIRSLFISLHSFNGIPADIMIANIISYLPSRTYKKLPLISKYFRFIMFKYAFIYNQKGYKVHIKQINPPNSFQFQHSLKTINISSNILLNNNDIKILLHNIKYWDISSIPNDSMTDIISNTNDQIQKLKLNGFHVMDEVINNKHKWQFKQCLVLTLNYNDPQTAPNINNKQLFSKLQCLELSVSQKHQSYNNNMYVVPFYRRQQNHLSNTFYDNLNEMLSYLSSTLKCLKLEWKRDELSTESPHPVYHSHSNDKILKIPNNMEWLQLINISNCKFDVSQCDKLIAIYLGNGVRNDNMIWPMSDNHMIPFVYFEDDSGGNNWNNICGPHINNKHKPNIRFVAFNYGSTTRPNFFSLNNKKKVKINQVMLNLQKLKNEDNIKCLELDESELNYPHLFCMLMKYTFDNQRIRDEKILQYKQWWRLRSALWINRINYS